MASKSEQLQSSRGSWVKDWSVQCKKTIGRRPFRLLNNCPWDSHFWDGLTVCSCCMTQRLQLSWTPATLSDMSTHRAARSRRHICREHRFARSRGITASRCEGAYIHKVAAHSSVTTRYVSLQVVDPQNHSARHRAVCISWTSHSTAFLITCSARPSSAECIAPINNRWTRGRRLRYVPCLLSGGSRQRKRSARWKAAHDSMPFVFERWELPSEYCSSGHLYHYKSLSFLRGCRELKGCGTGGACFEAGDGPPVASGTDSYQSRKTLFVEGTLLLGCRFLSSAFK